jgi:hypothetical protein
MLMLDTPKNALFGAKTFHWRTHGANRSTDQAFTPICKELRNLKTNHCQCFSRLTALAPVPFTKTTES